MTGDPAKREEAMEILDQPVVLLGSSGSARLLGVKELEAQTLLDLTSFRIAKYPSVDASQRPALMAKIDEAYAKIYAEAVADAIPVLRLRGLICQLKGQNVEAVGHLRGR